MHHSRQRIHCILAGHLVKFHSLQKHELSTAHELSHDADNNTSSIQKLITVWNRECRRRCRFFSFYCAIREFVYKNFQRIHTLSIRRASRSLHHNYGTINLCCEFSVKKQFVFGVERIEFIYLDILSWFSYGPTINIGYLFSNYLAFLWAVEKWSPKRG